MVINSFAAMIDMSAHFKCKTSSFFNDSNKNSWILFNFEHSMCSIGISQSYDGGVTFHWQSSSNLAIRETKDGLQWFDISNHNMHSWKFFDDEVQEAYVGYKLEKEML